MIFQTKVKFLKEFNYFSKQKLTGSSYITLKKVTTSYFLYIPIYTKQEVVSTSATL